MSRGVKTAIVAWLVTAIYFFYQYALRSSPAVMMPQLADAFGLTAMGVASMVGMFYWGYSPFSLVAGAAMDGLGPRKVVPLGAAAVGIGALLFATGNGSAATAGRFLQGAGGAVAFVGAVYLATKYFPASRAATLIGATQMFGMAGGSAGQFAVGPLITAGVLWSTFWVAMGAGGIVIALGLFALIPAPDDTGGSGWLREGCRSLAAVFRNPQTILCGVIAGLLFIPTTIFDMIWGVRYLQDAHGFEYGDAVLRSSMVPLGWIIGCPLLGFVSDRLGRRKPVILGGAAVLLACLFWILYGPKEVLPPYVLGLVAGIASGSAILPTTVAKEANPPAMAGTSTGVVNFLNFTFSALLGPVFGRVMVRVSAGASSLTLEHYQTSFKLLLYGVMVAMVLVLILRETGPAARRVTRPAQAPVS
jgi:MFS family permease